MRKCRSIRWTISALFVGAMVLNYLSGSILGLAAPAIMAEQHISVLGSLVEQIGYQPFFILLGVVDLLGAALLWTLIRKPA